MTDQTPPTVIGGRYETVRPIGRGGMGVVWLARDTVLGRAVAAKQIGDFPGESVGETHRAMREARAAAALNHPNVVAVYDVVDHDGSPWLVMEYVAGPTLATAIRQRGPMAAKGAADLGAQLAGALDAAHRAGVVHRDIKPANVLIGGGLPKLGDFGIARSGTEEHVTQTGLVTGTPNYMAPEVAVGRPHGEAADVWALGATIYFAVEGQDAHPSQGNALATLQSVASRPPRRPERAGVLEPVLADMLSRDPARRGSMSEALRRLENIAAGGVDVPAAPAPSAPTSSEGAKGGPPLLWVVLGILAVALVTAAIVFAVRGGGASDSSAAATGRPTPSATSSVTTSEAAASTSSTRAGESSQESIPNPLGLAESEADDFIRDYFSTVTTDTDASWQMLSPERRNNRAGYDEFWGGIDSAVPDEVSVDRGAGTVDVALALKPSDRPVVTEDHTYQLSRLDGELKIDSAKT